MYTFPKDQNIKSQWVKNINRQDSNASVIFKSWQPNVDSRICSDYFEDEFPTEKNPYPTLKMGHDLKVVTPRKPPLQRV